MSRRKVSTVAAAEQLQVGSIARGVTSGNSFYTLQLNEDGHWDQMGCDDMWEHSSLFPFFDHLDVIYQPNERA